MSLVDVRGTIVPFGGVTRADCADNAKAEPALAAPTSFNHSRREVSVILARLKGSRYKQLLTLPQSNVVMRTACRSPGSAA